MPTALRVIDLDVDDFSTPELTSHLLGSVAFSEPSSRLVARAKYCCLGAAPDLWPFSPLTETAVLVTSLPYPPLTYPERSLSDKR